jgi:hypothetical protein
MGWPASSAFQVRDRANRSRCRYRDASVRFPPNLAARRAFVAQLTVLKRLLPIRRDRPRHVSRHGVARAVSGRSEALMSDLRSNG